MHKHLTTQSDQDRERYPPENMSTTAGHTKGSNTVATPQMAAHIF